MYLGEMHRPQNGRQQPAVTLHGKLRMAQHHGRFCPQGGKKYPPGIVDESPGIALILCGESPDGCPCERPSANARGSVITRSSLFLMG